MLSTQFYSFNFFGFFFIFFLLNCLCLFLHPFFQFNRENINNNIKFRIKMIKKNKTKNNQFTIKYEHKKNWNFYFRVKIFSVFFLFFFSDDLNKYMLGMNMATKDICIAKRRMEKNMMKIECVLEFGVMNWSGFIFMSNGTAIHSFIYLFIFFYIWYINRCSLLA